MKISDRDKKLIIYAACVVLIICAFFFGFKKITASSAEIDKEIEKNQAYLDQLKQMQADEKKYKEDTEYYTAECNSILDKYDTGYSLEYSVMFVDEMEKSTDMWASQTAFEDTIQLYKFGNVTSTNPLKSGGGKVYDTDYAGYGTKITMSYQANYEDFKALIDYINTYKYKCKIDSVSCAYNKETDVVSGSLIITIYAITGSDREFLGAPVSQKFFGTENIFNSYTFTPGDNAEQNNGNNILSDYDYYIALDSFKADADSVVIGPRGDSPATRISKNSSEKEDIEIKFTGKDGDYKVSYKIGEVTYPSRNYEEGTSFNPGSMLSLLVAGSRRDPEGDDTNGVNATIINETDMKLSVKIVDDKENPRFAIKEKMGDIEIFE